MTTSNISLRIAGTKQRRAGFAPLASFGIFPEKEQANMDRSTQVGEKPTYVVKHTSDYLLYMLVDNKVKAFDTETSGVLSIAMAISRNVELPNQTSPYDVLKEVYDMFRKNYMEPLPDGRDCFKDIEINQEDFERIMWKYKDQMVPVRRIVQVMPDDGPTGILRVPDFKLSSFFLDTQYPEFMKFKDVEVGTNCESSAELKDLTIPRPKPIRKDPPVVVSEPKITNSETPRKSDGGNVGTVSTIGVQKSTNADNSGISKGEENSERKQPFPFNIKTIAISALTVALIAFLLVLGINKFCKSGTNEDIKDTPDTTVVEEGKDDMKNTTDEKTDKKDKGEESTDKYPSNEQRPSTEGNNTTEKSNDSQNVSMSNPSSGSSTAYYDANEDARRQYDRQRQETERKRQKAERERQEAERRRKEAKSEIKTDSKNPTKENKAKDDTTTDVGQIQDQALNFIKQHNYKKAQNICSQNPQLFEPAIKVGIQCLASPKTYWQGKDLKIVKNYIKANPPTTWDAVKSIQSRINNKINTEEKKAAAAQGGDEKYINNESN